MSGSFLLEPVLEVCLGGACGRRSWVSMARCTPAYLSSNSWVDIVVFQFGALLGELTFRPVHSQNIQRRDWPLTRPQPGLRGRDSLRISFGKSGLSNSLKCRGLSGTEQVGKRAPGVKAVEQKWKQLDPAVWKPGERGPDGGRGPGHKGPCSRRRAEAFELDSERNGSKPSVFSKKLLDWLFHHKNLSDLRAISGFRFRFLWRPKRICSVFPPFLPPPPPPLLMVTLEGTTVPNTNAVTRWPFPIHSVPSPCCVLGTSLALW